ncbi:hypothetical protein [Fredinandcohnia quinoae]|uniref:Prepilin-type N-terminal cleavage/methylation domain-containing protein n=1 Tax=Fredinandcohnia quinoae TaxID=2918902 RepID=A0AAW5E9M6_9BACI|nr:hypothetical protein [Fredinandcohnia sp. SECRCQ15]MCH1626587.1 hypothetical protein [Fredinandcohnia sp. SECRCQ15]
MNSRFKSIFSEKGITLLEVLTSIVILTIIVITFLSMYIQSASTNNVSKDILDTTYIAQSEMEAIYNINKNEINITDGLSRIQNGLGYRLIRGDYNADFNFYKIVNDYYILLSIQAEGNESELYKVIINIFNDSSMSQKEAQIETLFSWENSKDVSDVKE